MGLKKATVGWTAATGEKVTRVFRIRQVIFDYERGTIETIYVTHVSDEAASRGAVPVEFRQRVMVDFNDDADIALVMQASDRIWEKNVSEAFIEDYTELDENGRQKMIYKSFRELKAEVAEA